MLLFVPGFGLGVGVGFGVGFGFGLGFGFSGFTGTSGSAGFFILAVTFPLIFACNSSPLAFYITILEVVKLATPSAIVLNVTVILVIVLFSKFASI